MDSTIDPTIVVASATTGYGVLLTLLRAISPPPSTETAATNLKLLSSLHATLSTTISLYSLSRPWKTSSPTPPLNLGLGTSIFNDSLNPLIAGRSALGNLLTGLETGYLLFDTLALFHITHESGSSLRATVRKLMHRDPLILFHHLSLLAGLGALQYFITQRRERGVGIIVAFILMNASTPLLHLRWYLIKRTGMRNAGVDALLTVVFGACRLGTIVWVLREYGRFHGVGVWEALRGQRWVCQVGTGALFGLNALWLGGLVRSTIRRILGRKT